MKLSLIALVGLASQLACAVKMKLPRETDNIANALGLGFSPLPTEAPRIPRLHPDLIKRQSSGSLIGYFAPDNTCGFVSGISSSSKTCDSTELCAAVVISGVASMGCCNPGAGDCTFLGDCVGSSAYYSSSICNAACKADPNTVKCTSSARPFCYSFLVPGMSMGFFSCESTTSSEFAPFWTSARGGLDHSWTKVYDTDVTSGVRSSRTSGGGGFNFNSITSNLKADTSLLGAVTSSLGPPSSTSLIPTPGPEPKKSNVAAIAGGVVGGLAVLGALVFGIVFLLMRSKHKEAQHPHPHGGSPGAVPMPPSNPHGPAGPGAMAQTPGAPPHHHHSAYYPPPSGFVSPPSSYASPQPYGGTPSPGADPSHLSFYGGGAAAVGVGVGVGAGAGAGAMPAKDGSGAAAYQQDAAGGAHGAQQGYPTKHAGLDAYPAAVPQSPNPPPPMYTNAGSPPPPPLSQQQQQQGVGAPAELGASYAIPSHNRDGQRVFEAA